MKQFYRASGLLTALASVLTPAALPSADQIVAGVEKRSERQDRELQAYSVTRRYTLRNRHLSGTSSVTALLVYQAGHGKEFSILRAEGPGVTQRALTRLLRDEEKSSKENPSENAINNSNYQFTMIGEETHDGRLCYRLKIVPHEKSKLLLDGDAWVDVQDLAVVAIKGRPAKSISFWVGRPLIEQHFAPIHGFWMPSGNQTSAQVKLAGETELNIDYWNYRFNLPESALRAP